MTTNTDVAMPELPEPESYRREWDGDESDLGSYVHADSKDELDNLPWEPLYTADQMRDYARVAIADLQQKLDDMTADYLRRHREVCELKYGSAAIQQAAVPKTEDLRELLAKAPRLHAMLTMGGCPSCGSKDCIALSCQLEPPKQQPVHLGGGECGGVPLTSDRIKKIHAEYANANAHGGLAWHDFARAIERAHGITAGQGMEGGV